MSLETPTWPTIIGGVGSTTTEFGASDWANLISDYYNGVNIGLTDATKIPIIGTLTRFKPDKLGLYDTDQSHYLVFSIDDIDTGPVRKVKFRRMNSPFTDDYAVLEGMTQALANKTIDADLNTITNIENADIKAAAAIATTKLADSTNFILKTLDNSFGAHYFDMTSMTAPGNPAANDGRVYTKQIDANNDGLFCKIKKAGGFVEVQIL